MISSTASGLSAGSGFPQSGCNPYLVCHRDASPHQREEIELADQPGQKTAGRRTQGVITVRTAQGVIIVRIAHGNN